MSIIKNKRSLSTTPARKLVLDIIEAGIKRVLPQNVMKSSVAFDPAKRVLMLADFQYSLDKGRVFVIGGGKASGAMAEALDKIVPPEYITAGIVTCKGDTSGLRTNKTRIIEAGHPLPDKRGVNAVKAMLALKSQHQIGKNDLVICLISGGGSSLMPYPAEGITLDDKRATTNLLLKCGATIDEINAVRKHLSGIKGGRLGLHFAPATVVSLILSDVVGNNLNVIASGPTVPDTATFSDAWGIISRYDLTGCIPACVRGVLQKGLRGEIQETPKKLANCRNYIIGDNRLALEAMKQRAEALGKKAYIVTAEQTGDTGGIAECRADEIIHGRYAQFELIMIGGETTLKVPPGTGKGGRNQHYALVSIPALQEYSRGWTLAAVGSDGSDFLPDVAGAMVDCDSLTVATKKGLEPKSFLQNFDSYTALKRLGHSLVVTGDTGTNVGDFIVYALA